MPRFTTSRWNTHFVILLAFAGLGRDSAAADIPVTASGPPASDLSIVSVAVASGGAVPGTPVALDVVVRSGGPCLDCGPVQISYWDDSADGNVNCGDGATLNTVAQVPPQSDATVRVVLNGYPRPGKYRAWVWVDCQTAVAETDETNNKGYVDIEVNGSALDPGKPGDSGQIPADGSQDGSSADTTASASPGFCGIWGQSAAAVASEDRTSASRRPSAQPMAYP